MYVYIDVEKSKAVKNNKLLIIQGRVKKLTELR